MNPETLLKTFGAFGLVLIALLVQNAATALALKIVFGKWVELQKQSNEQSLKWAMASARGEASDTALAEAIERCQEENKQAFLRLERTIVDDRRR